MQRWLTLCSFTIVYGALWVTGVAAQRVVVVKENDTVWSLAKRYQVMPQDIVKANGLKNPDALKPGSHLKIPAPVKPTVVPVSMRKTGVINGDRVCIRYAPQRTDRSVTILDKGHPVLVTARRGNWLQVQLPSGRVGWVRDDLVRVTGTLTAKTAPAKPQRVARHPVTPPQSAHKNSMRTASHRKATPASSPLREIASDGSTSDSHAGESIVRTASRLRGVRYRWGGSSRSGFDCSGFTRYVFRQRAAIDLPHSASAQFRMGKPVRRIELKPGDLVFFQTYRRGASHVGIYIGNGKFIHASSAGGRVRVDSLNDGYYRQRYLGARRVVR